MNKEQAKNHFLERAIKIRNEIHQIFADVDHWNANVRKKTQVPIDPDPDGKLAYIRVQMDKFIKDNSGGGTLKLQELFSDEGKWSKDFGAMDETGKRVAPDSKEAVKWSLLAGIIKVYGYDENFEIYDRVRKHLGIHYIEAWNIDRERTFADIRRVIEELNI